MVKLLDFTPPRPDAHRQRCMATGPRAPRDQALLGSCQTARQGASLV